MRAIYAIGGVVVLVGLSVLLWTVAGAARRRAIATPLDPTSQFRNHQAMARWIDHQLSDEMASASIPSAERQAGRDLLAEFYGDEPGKALQ